MPVYEYRCQGCQSEFEDLVRLNTPDEEIECPSCGKHHATRVLSVVASQSKRPAIAASGPGCGAASGSGCGSTSGFS